MASVVAFVKAAIKDATTAMMTPVTDSFKSKRCLAIINSTIIIITITSAATPPPIVAAIALGAS